MSKWTIEDQEKSVKSSVITSGCLATVLGVFLLEEITLRWFGLVKISDVIGIAAFIPVIYFIRKIWQQPNMLSYGWQLREIKGDFQDEYLRSNYQRATTLAFQLMIMIGFLSFMVANVVVNQGEPEWISYKLVTLFPVFIGSLSFYLSLRNVLNEQDESAEDNQ